MTAGCLATCAVAAMAWPGRPIVELLFGMLGPLVAVAASWESVVRAHRRDPAQVTGVLMHAFLVKALFFAGYVAAMIKLVGVSPYPFVASFVFFFVALYAVEASMLRRLQRA
jgi:hypothetical protein